MTLTSVVDQLREQIGLDPASLGPTVVPTVVGGNVPWAYGNGGHGEHLRRLRGKWRLWSITLLCSMVFAAVSCLRTWPSRFTILLRHDWPEDRFAF